MGVDDYLYSGAWCFIEWAEQIRIWFEEHSVIRITEQADGKRVLELS
jgi:tRNA threonylcarbamoyladenosine biosynthesis protein TsaE